MEFIPMTKGVSGMKTKAMLMMKSRDQIIADLMTGSFNMGVKLLHKYLNEYKAADKSSRRL